MTVEACAAIVARDDPRLHATALFAPEPGRSALMVLYAFDVELSRAAQSSTESLIPRMRLQWWRDMSGAALQGDPPPAHEVAGPFASLLAEHALPAALVEAPVEAREMELEGGFDAARFAAWTDARFGALTAMAAHLLTEGDAQQTVAVARGAGPALGAAFALRNARRMTADGRSLLPGLSPADRAALAEGHLTQGASEAIRGVASQGLEALAALRRQRGRIDRRSTAAFLPLAGAGRVLGRAARVQASGPPQRMRGSFRRAAAAAGDLDDAERPFDGLRLALRAATGRW